ncbi:MAG: hypothetical protein MUC92_12385 [Fimbriimonadaceae bacterium]|jgi:hypothetical protein|nr:hypothetical protein [Fimbriimonadaceae bacterium]
MFVSAFALVALSQASQPATAPPQERVDINRQFTVGQRLNYQVRSSLLLEIQEYGRPFFQPVDQEVNYDFYQAVTGIDEAGFAKLEYSRTMFEFVMGESSLGPRASTKENPKDRFELRLSRVNAITDFKQIQAPKPASGRSGGAMELLQRIQLSRALARAGATPEMQVSVPPFLLNFANDMRRLALFVGSFESSMDFAPMLPLRSPRLGETWRQTVSSAPQQLRGKNQQAVQRVDVTYKYDGLVTENGQRFHKVTGVYSLDSDAAAYVNQVVGATPAETGLRRMPLKLDGKLTFLLDEKTRHTVRGTAEAKGGWSIIITQLDQPILEERISGRSTLRLASTGAPARPGQNTGRRTPR